MDIKDINNEFPTIEYFNENPKGHRLERHVKNKFPDFYAYLLNNYPSDLKWMEKLYRYFHNVNETPVCIECGSPVKFWNFDKGYFQYCCQKCSNNSSIKMNKTIQTMKKKYGVNNASKLQFVKDKKDATMEKHYGVKHLFQSKEYQQKLKEKIKEKYGVEYIQQSPEIKEKTRRTNIERYGGTGMESTILKEKVKATNLERYGVEYAYQIPGIYDKMKKTCLERYGAENIFASPEFKDWLKRYNLERYGNEYSICSQSVKDKIKQTMIDRYGVENPSHIAGVRDKARQTTFDRYGKEYYPQTHEYHELMNEIIDDVVKKRYQTQKKNKSFNTSKIEQQFKQWLDDNCINYMKEHKSEDYPFRCDFYFPDQDLYLEIQGHQTHGGHPFDPNNQEDQDKLKKLQEKDRHNIIKVWTIRDPLKRQWARDHGLNWMEVFTTNINDLITRVKPLLFRHNKNIIENETLNRTN